MSLNLAYRTSGDRTCALRGTVAAVMLCGALCAGAQSAPDFSRFETISQRNIFNANRSGGAPERRVEPRPAPVRVEAVTLVGTLDYRKGPFAFFDSGDADYRQVLQPGGTIAGHTITEIAGGEVKLRAETNQLAMRVGMQLHREGDGPWQVRDATESAAAFGSGERRDEAGGRDSRREDDRRRDWRGSDGRREETRGDPSGASPSGPATPAPPAAPVEEDSEILRRLMEQRERETR